MRSRTLAAALSIASGLAVLAISAPTFAAVEGNGQGQEAGSQLTLSITQETQNGQTLDVLQVGNIQTTNSNSELLFRGLTASDVNNFTANDDVGTSLPATDFTLITTPPTNYSATLLTGQNWPTTATFTIPASDLSAYVEVTVAQYSPDQSKEYEGEDPGAPIPTGNLPETPYAVAFPAAAILAGAGVVWARRKASRAHGSD